jgi:hypothetical protein
MDRLGDTGRKMERHLKSAWARTFLCTVQEVRESIAVSLLGIRTKLRPKEPLPKTELLYLLNRCDDVLDQVRVLIGRKDRRHAKTFIRIVRGYQERIGAMLQSDHDHGDTRGAETGE